MSTTVGIFYADLVGGSTVFRVGNASLGVDGHQVAGLLPALVRTGFAARSLTEQETYPTILEGALHKGWQDLNFVYDAGGWYPLFDMLGNRGERLQCLPAFEEEVTEMAPVATDYQRKKIIDMTKSHVFDKDRDEIRATAARASAEEAGAMITALAEQLRIRPRLHPKGWRNRSGAPR